MDKMCHVLWLGDNTNMYFVRIVCIGLTESSRCHTVIHTAYTHISHENQHSYIAIRGIGTHSDSTFTVPGMFIVIAFHW